MKKLSVRTIPQNLQSKAEAFHKGLLAHYVAVIS